MAETGAGRACPPPTELLRRVAGLAAIPQAPEVAGATRTTSDAVLIEACRQASIIGGRKLALFGGVHRHMDDRDRDVQLARLDAAQRPFIDIAANSVPGTWTGHVVRALTFQVLDSGALYANARFGSVAERLLAAIIHDLATS